MKNKVTFSFETESAIRKACDVISMKCTTDLLLDLWSRKLISDEVFAKKMQHISGLLIDFPN